MHAFREWPGYDFLWVKLRPFNVKLQSKAESHSGQQNKRKYQYQCADILFQCKQMFVASFNEPINEL